MKSFFGKLFFTIFPILIYATIITGCDENTTETPDRLLERPKMAAFFCTLKDDMNNEVWHTSQDCVDNDDAHFYSIVLSSSRGELALVDLKSKKIVDLDPITPGYNLLPAPKTVIKIMVDDKTGELITISRNPAVISKISIDTILKKIMGENLSDPITSSYFSTTEGNLRTTVSDIVENYDTGDFYAIFPGCSMVGRVTQDGTILEAWKTDDGTNLLSKVTGSVECPVEGPEIEGSATGNSNALPSVFPSVLTIDGSNLYIGFNSNENGETDKLFHLTLDATGSIVDATVINVESGTGGWRKLKISPMTRWGKFLYGITMKGDIRVISLNNFVECETNPTSSELQDLSIDDSKRGCIPVGTINRDFISKTPGISLGSNRKAQDISFFKYTTEDETIDYTKKSSYLGIFGAVISMDGLMFLINVDEQFDDNLYNYRYGVSENQCWPEEVLAHHIRNAVNIDGSYSNEGRPRLNSEVGYYKEGSIYYRLDGEPEIITSSDGTDYFEGYISRPETWYFTYEGTLPNSNRNFGIMEEAQTGYTLTDEGALFCSKGIIPGDVVKLTGCYDDNECPEGYSCGRTPIQNFDSNGICFPSKFKSDYVMQCARLLASDREYLVTGVTNNSLQLSENPLYDLNDEDPTTPHSCSKDADCYDLGVEQGGVCNDNGICISAPSPKTDDSLWCFSGLLNYEVRIDKAFLMHGGVTGYTSPLVVDASGQCVENSEQYFNYRISADSGLKETPFFNIDIQRDENVPIPYGYEMQIILDGAFLRYYGDLGVRLPSWSGIGPDGNIYVTDMGDSGSVIGQFVKVLPQYFSLDAEFIVR